MNAKKVSSTVKKNSFNYQKSKMMATLILDGFDKREISTKFYSENKIYITSLPRRREVTNEIYRRLIHLDSTLLKAFVSQDIITSKFILVYAIAKVDKLFYEFLSMVYREALLGDKKYISRDDFDHFFLAKKESDLIVASWSPVTIELLAKGYRKLLVDSALGIRKVKNIYVNKIFVHPEISKYIESIGDYNYIQAILGER
jgi:hypothetical protein